METDEVITEEIVKDFSCNKFNEQVLSNKENNSDLIIIENSSTLQTENMKNNTFKVNQITNNCEMSLIEKSSVTKQHCNDKNDINDQQKESFNKLSANHNETSNNSDNHKEVVNGLAIEDLVQKNVDISVIHEKRNDKLSSLTSIAIEYQNSESETEDTLDFNNEKNDQTTIAEEMQAQPYRIINNESSSTEESDDDSSNNTDCLVINESNDSDSDDSTNKRNKRRTTKEQKNNEMKSELDDLPPIEDLKISVPEVLCDPFGEVAWMVEQLVVVKPKPDKPTLNLDTILFVDKGKRALGKIFDVFGQVKEPHYCIRFNSSKHIQECDIKVGMTVYYCPNTDYTSLVFLHELMKIKGIDANADEPPEFSDDEEERVYYEKLKQTKQNSLMHKDVPFKRKRASSPNSSWQSNHPWNRNKQKNRKGYYSRGNTRQLSSAQGGNHLQNLWVPPYQNNWPNTPGGLRPSSSESYEYGMYPSPLQSTQYVNSTVNNLNQNFYSSHNYYNEDGTVPLNPRIPYNTCPRVTQEHLLFQNRPNSSANLRFRNPNMTWQQQMSQNPENVNTPWISLPPPPPPPPPSSLPSSPGTN